MRLDTKKKRLNYRQAIHVDPHKGLRVRAKQTDNLCLVSHPDEKGRVSVKFFSGSSAKPAKYIRYQTTDKARLAIDAWVTEAPRKRTQREYCNKALEVGSYLVSIWGYDQTNVDYYKILRRVGKTMVELVQVSSAVGQVDSVGNHKVVPTDEVNTIQGAKPFKAKMSVDGSVKVGSSSWARPWDGRPRDETGFYNCH